MSGPLRPVGFNRSVDDELLALHSSIDLHQKAINEEGVWLFLAVLGCWSVSPSWPRLIALLAAMYLFGFRYSAYETDRRDFKGQFRASRERIAAITSAGDERAVALERLDSVESERLGGLRPFYKVPGFVVGWAGFTATLVLTYIDLLPAP